MSTRSPRSPRCWPWWAWNSRYSAPGCSCRSGTGDYAIVLAFQIPVDGLLTHRTAPVVFYSDAATSGIRFPADIPIEDFAFGFALVTLTLLLWRRQQRSSPPGGEDG